MAFATEIPPENRSSLGLSDMQVVTVLNLLCLGAANGRDAVKPGMREEDINRVVRKEIRRAKRSLGIGSLEVSGEREIDDSETRGPSIRGRIDIVLEFLQQFGDEDAYVGVECKRVAAGDSRLNSLYVTQGIDRFVTGRYCQGHRWAFMLGYVLVLPVSQIVTYIATRVESVYGISAVFRRTGCHPDALEVMENVLQQNSNSMIRLKHIFVDMVPANAGH